MMLSGIDTFAVRRIRGNPSATNASFSDGGFVFGTPVVRCFDPAGATVRTQAVAPVLAFNRLGCKFDAPNVMIGSRDCLGVSCSTSAKQADITHRPRPVVPCPGPIDPLFTKSTHAHTVQSAPGLTSEQTIRRCSPGAMIFTHPFEPYHHQSPTKRSTRESQKSDSHRSYPSDQCAPDTLRLCQPSASVPNPTPAKAEYPALNSQPCTKTATPYTVTGLRVVL